MKKLIPVFIILLACWSCEKERTYSLPQDTVRTASDTSAHVLAMESGSTPCNTCHTCDTPTVQNPCLIACPRDKSSHITSGKHAPDEGPEIVIIDQLKKLYEPVIFQHRLHSSMSAMGVGCSACHHYSPEGEIPPCRECHSEEAISTNLRQPSLKGAYHRQCLNCHREWSHDTDCDVCHLPLDRLAPPTPQPDKTDIIGVDHPTIHIPEKQIFKTPDENNTIVTFHHQEHVDLYRYRCVDCHRDENCSQCHEGVGMIKSFGDKLEMHHSPCSDCHNTTADKNCNFCHMQEESKGFTHDLTGWPLSRFHKALTCASCHPQNRPLQKLNKTCTACHTNWFVGNFDHSVTGLTLSESHEYFDCYECHLDEQYDQPPQCETCHDYDVIYPEDLPGEKE
ncbi:MAG: cytochrome c family protein [Lentisphaeria bacterium]|nr:cytochrome c family protein [Candidatus Neomarinimicrobiota bacterium]MCF7842118.1 cytochrome c family protein [Lentisphaeria bacterium]